MENKKVRPPFGLLIAAVLLVVFGYLYNRFILVAIPVDQQIENVILTAINFLSIFIAILLVYIFLINVFSQVLSNRISEKVYKPINFILTAGIIISILMMLQPFTIVLYKYSFPVLLLSLLSFILWSHIIPDKSQREDKNVGYKI